ncbi:hypothetical protein TBK1r_75500 [Stieleria magnilauensis]|uniref:Uncharacterized protein n=1 Tax=Stieleria magnilauensis TaxID=2527963 RepID=A0ABX5Y680_9BACT|nr:hypothetical protein TBK1r_75500 [Planctomycetes bacterium TBK1r]
MENEFPVKLCRLPKQHDETAQWMSISLSLPRYGREIAH